jgi:succinate dehydrogenase / fumarate reductase cytochrome b subunit
MPLLDMTLARDGKTCFWTSSVGRKLIMAITGFSLVGFVTAHALGNLTVYLGREAINGYAAFLQGMAHGHGIWVFRGAMLAIVLVHALTALSLTLDSWSARRHGYREQKLLAASWASRTMRYTAVILCLFIIYHLLHMTIGWAEVHPSFGPDVYENFVAGFQNPYASAFYIIANLCQGLHIWHGVWSFSQTLGLSHPRYDMLRKRGAFVWAIAVAGINISYPIAVLSRVVGQ